MKVVRRDVRPRPSDELPARLTSADMMRIFGIKAAWFSQLVRAKQFDHLEIRPRIGRRAWSGKKVMAYLNGDLQGAPAIRRSA